MLRTAVSSSSVVSIGYDDAALALDVEFKGGRVYRYAPVSQERYAEIVASESIGRAVNALKAEGIACERVEVPA